MNAATPFAKYVNILLQSAMELRPREFPELSQVERGVIIHKRNSGMVYSEIARQHRCSKQTVNACVRWAKIENIPLVNFKRGTNEVMV